MKKKTIIKIIIGMVAAVTICIAVILFIKSRRPDTIRLGMTEEEFISFCKRNNYEYTHHEYSEEYKINNKILLNKVEGTISASILDDVHIVRFRVNLVGADNDDINEKLGLLNEYLYKRYGTPFQEGDTATAYAKKGVCAVLIYSMDKNEILIMWQRCNF